MKTVTNFYILQLAVADECFLIGIPFLIVTMHNGNSNCSLFIENCVKSRHVYPTGGWVFGEFVCKIYMFSQSITQFSSSIFLLIMSADRYIAGKIKNQSSIRRFWVEIMSRRNGKICEMERGTFFCERIEGILWLNKTDGGVKERKLIGNCGVENWKLSSLRLIKFSFETRRNFFDWP